MICRCLVSSGFFIRSAGSHWTVCLHAGSGFCNNVGLPPILETSRVWHNHSIQQHMSESYKRPDLLLLLRPVFDGTRRRGHQIVRHCVCGWPVRQWRCTRGQAQDVFPKLVVREHQLRHHAVCKHPGVCAGQRGLVMGVWHSYCNHRLGYFSIPFRDPCLQAPDSIRQPTHPCGPSDFLRCSEVEPSCALQQWHVVRSCTQRYQQRGCSILDLQTSTSAYSKLAVSFPHYHT